MFLNVNFRRFLFGKTPPKSEKNLQNCTDYFQRDRLIKYADKSLNSRWTCTAQFDLFFPEPKDAPHIVFNTIDTKEKNLFDVPLEYIPSQEMRREAWSKIL